MKQSIHSCLFSKPQILFPKKYVLQNVMQQTFSSLIFFACDRNLPLRSRNFGDQTNEVKRNSCRFLCHAENELIAREEIGK